MKINWSSVESKVKRRLQEKDMVDKMERKVDEIMLSPVPGGGRNIHTVADAGKKYTEVLHRAIEACCAGSGSDSQRPLGETALDALRQIDVTSGSKIGKLTYQVGVYFNSNLHRDSLVPEFFDGIDNIAALLNNGYRQTKSSVYGLWHGKHIEGLRSREGAHFMQDAKLEFGDNYGAEYGIIDIKIDEYE
jgi:hypothetical protein